MINSLAVTALITFNKIASLPIFAALGDDIGQGVDDVKKAAAAAGANPQGGSAAIATFINDALGLIMPVGLFCLLLLLSYGGFKMITSQGNPEQINEAKEIITNALMGFAMISLSAVILVLINNVLNLGI